MRDELDPIAGNWYRHLEKDQMFKVLGIDEDRDVIEIQYFDGDVEEIEGDAWSEMDLDAAEAPENESEGLDGETDRARSASDHDWRESSDAKEPEDWDDDSDDEDDDDWDDDDDSEEYYDSE
jgi:Family of unknown function (DUF6763)